MISHLTWRDRAWLWYCRNYEWVIDVVAFAIAIALTVWFLT